MNAAAVRAALVASGEQRATDVLRVALQAGACPRCAMRFMPVKSVGAYEASEEALIEALRTLGALEDDDVAVQDRVCVVCLGILQDRVMRAVAEACAKSVREFDHDGVTRLNLSAPPACSTVRHRSMRLHVDGKVGAKSDDEAVSLRQAAKFALGNTIESAIGATYEATSSFFSNVHFSHDAATAEVARALGKQGDRAPDKRVERMAEAKRRKTGVPFESFPSWMDRDVSSIEKACSAMNDAKFRRLFDVPPRHMDAPVTFDVLCSVSDIFIAGRYLKFSRKVSQSPWRIEPEDGEESKVITSVEELVTPTFKAALGAEQVTLVPGGREDVDVRMLGTGRPFVLRCSGSKKVPARVNRDLLDKLQEEVNRTAKGLVKIVDLQSSGRERLDWLKDVEGQKRKTYACVLWFERTPTAEDVERLNAMGSFDVVQKTPLRVFHRRSAADRKKHVYGVRARALRDSYLAAEIDAEAGTYIKELVHGDLGRTNPSFRSIFGCTVDIVQLDVIRIHMGDA